MGYFQFNKDNQFTRVDVQYDLSSFNAQLMKNIPAPVNKATELANAFFDMLTKTPRNINMLNDLLAPDFTSNSYPVPNATREQFIGGIKATVEAFPDIKITVTRQHNEGNQVFTYGYWTGTNTGSFMGAAPTGKKVKVEFMDVWIEEHGKLVRNEVVMDIAGLQAQLGDPAVAKTERNIKTTKTLYDSFSKGNIPAVMAMLSDQVVWTDAGTGVGNLYAGTRHGKDQVLSFFKELNDHVSTESLIVNEYIAQGDMVIANGIYRGTARATDRRIVTDFSMTWEYDAQGKAVRHHLYLDTDNISKAIAGTPNHVATVRLAYQDFLGGNIEGVIASLADNIVWMHPADKSKVPFAGTYKGKDEVREFFSVVSKSIKPSVFHPYDYKQTGNIVTNKLLVSGKAISTNADYEVLLTVKSTFDSKGRIVKWEAHGDTASLEHAFAQK
jgi:ketosteroid isomerase-like protein